MDRERHRFVQQYVERQQAYLPTYIAVDPLIERHGTPLKPPPRSDEYGFDTPVLRPRALVKSPEAQLPLQAGPSKSHLRTHEVDPSNQVRPPTPHRDARLETRDADLAKKGKSRIKRKKHPTPTPIDTDDERAARLTDRRERKRKKQAIVNPLPTHDDDVEPTAAPKKGRTNRQKAKKPASLALLYGFSATNVTKDRLTVKPAPFLGVFSKGKASAKKKVATTKRSSSRNELFSEFAFLNKSNKRAADPSKVGDNSDNRSASSVSSIPQERGKKKCINSAGTAATKAPQPSTGKVAESEVWDIELQSKLPSSVCHVSSETSRTGSSAPVVLDLRGAEWSVCLDTVENHAERLNKETRTPSTLTTRCRPEGHSVVHSSPLAISSLRGMLGPTLAADVSSIHPSHSASRIGARTAETGPSDLRLATSKYFAGPTPAPVQEFHAKQPQALISTDDIDVPDSRIPEQDVRDAALDMTIRRVASPITSLISVPQSMVQYQTRYDMVPLEFPSDSSPYEGFCADVDVHWDLLGRPDRGYVEPYTSVEPCHHLPQGDTWDWCQTWSPSAGLATDDVDIEATYDDALAPECGDHLDGPEPLIEACYFEPQAEFDPEEEERWYCAAETRHDLAIYDDQAVDGVYEVSLDGEEVPGFLEGRALLLGIPEDEGRAQCMGITGLAQAEMDVASRLRDHWRPLRL